VELLPTGNSTFVGRLLPWVATAVKLLTATLTVTLIERNTSVPARGVVAAGSAEIFYVSHDLSKTS
jgi:hypothetical protein